MTYQSERKKFLTPPPAPSTPWYDSLPPGRLQGKPLQAPKTPKWELDLDAALDAEDRAEMALARSQAEPVPPVTPPPSPATLDETTVRYIHQFHARGVRNSDIAALCHITEGTVSRIISHQLWGHVALPADYIPSNLVTYPPKTKWQDVAKLKGLKELEVAEYLAFRRDPAVYAGVT
jgi:hypothetical protein